MKARYIDENHVEVFNPRVVVANNMVYTNPLNNPNFDMQKAGFKDIIEGEKPWYDPKIDKLVPYYVETNIFITICYRVEKLTEDEINEGEIY